MSHGRSLRLFLVDGTPGGIITAEIVNWTGHVLAAPRSRLGDLLKRPELAKTGVYILTGEDAESAGRRRAYVGQSDGLAKRLTQHARPEEAGGKDFWDQLVVVTSKDANLTTGHVLYLESRLIAIALDAGRLALENGTAPEPRPLPESDIADMEFFIEQLRIVLPLLNLDLLRERRVQPAGSRQEDATPTPLASPVFELSQATPPLKAYGQVIDGEFFVLQGSMARDKWSSTAHSYKRLYDSLVERGSLVSAPDGSHRLFTADVAFTSPSAAAAVVFGRPSNGRTEWRVKGTGQTYDGWERSSLDLAE